MPKVTFVNEHRTVDVEAGRLISDAAAEFGIQVCRESFAGTGIGDYTVWVRGEGGSVSPPGFIERLLGARGERRYANRAKILGDVEVWTQAGLGDRLRSPRPVTAAPRPTEDKTAARRPPDAAGTAAFPYGNPSAVGKGTRADVARNTAKAKVAKGAAAATEPEADDESESEGDE